MAENQNQQSQINSSLPDPGDSYYDVLDAEGWGMTEPTIRFINTLLPKFYQKTGVKVHLSSGLRPYDVNSYHSDGIAFDVWADEFEGNNALQDVYTSMSEDLGGTPLNEYPGREGEEYAHGDNIHISVHDQSGNYPGGLSHGKKAGDSAYDTAGSAAGTNTINNTQTSKIGFEVNWRKGIVKITPKKKTYCEPVYPDYVYVAGNIPMSVIQAATENNRNLSKVQSEDFALMTARETEILTGISATTFTTRQAREAAQKVYNAYTAINEVKVPNAGKPLNNTDPFPVDLKIEELEIHAPRVKQYELPFSGSISLAHAEAILALSDFTEKRLVKLENILSTVLRYTFATGSRIAVNCQYWGGTDHRAEEKCIGLLIA